MSTLLGVGVIAVLYLLTRKWPGMPSHVGRQHYVAKMPEILRMCWVERVIFVWSVVVAIFAIIMQIPWGADWGYIFLYLIAPLWVLLRAIDLAVAGPRYRQAARAVREAELPPYYTDPLTEVLPPGKPTARSRPDLSRPAQRHN